MRTIAIRGLALGALSAASVAAVGCGAQPQLTRFGTEWEDDGGKSVEALRTRIGDARPAVGEDVAIGIAGKADKIVGMSLESGTKWQFSHALDARPAIAGSIVVGSGGGEAFALDAKDGHKLWSRPTGGLRFRGAGDDGHVTALTFANAAGGGSVLLAITRDGRVEAQIETERELGSPAVFYGLAFVPWGNQYVSAIDLSEGRELARVLFREKTSRAWTNNGGLYFGELGFFRFDERIKFASRNQASHITVPARELPGSPRFLVPGSEHQRPEADAQDKIRLYARPSSPDGEFVIDSGRYYATYFRLAMAFDAKSGNLTWISTNAQDILAGAASSGGFVACDEKGKVSFLDAKTGGVKAVRDFGEPLSGCVLQVEDYVESSPPKQVKPLARQYEDALDQRESQLVTVQRLILRELAALEDDYATKVLVDLASDPRTAPELLPDARNALAGRRNGAVYMLDALKRHYDFLHDVLRAPPVGPMARALGAMRESRAAPLLAEHLLDPADTDDDVQQAAAALAVLANSMEVPTLRRFFGLYRATANSDELVAAVGSSGQALLQLGGADGRALVDYAVGDPMTVGDAKARLAALVEAQGAKPAESAPAPAETKAPSPKKLPKN